MNENLKYGLFFLGGIALGAIGAVAVSRGMDVKDALARKVATVKEDMEDLAAEARAAQKQRKGA